MKQELEITLDREANEPLYKQIAESIRGQLASGNLAPGQRLPTVRSLALLLGVSPITAFDAYRYLHRLRLVESTVGKGTSIVKSLRLSEGIEFLRSVPDRKMDMLFEVVASKSGVRSMASGVPDLELFPSDEFVAEIDELRNGKEWSFYYAPGPGAQVYLEAIAALLKHEGSDCSEDHLVATCGARHGLRLALAEFVKPGGSIVIEGYQSLGHAGLLATLDIGSTIVPRKDGAPDFETLRKIGGAAALYVAPTGCPATGRVMSLDERKQILEISSEKKWTVIEDATFNLINYGPAGVALADLSADVVQVGTLSCSLAPGLRLGYIRLSPKRRIRIVDRLQFEDGTGALFIQLAFASFVKRGRMKVHVQRVLPKYLSRRDITARALKDSMSHLATWLMPEAGFSFGLTLNQAVDQKRLLDACLKKGLAFAPGHNFSAPSEADKFLRISFGSRPSESIAQTIEEFARLVERAEVMR